MKQVTKNQTTLDIINNIKKIYADGGWNAVYSYLRIAKVPHEINKVEFGLETCFRSRLDKSEWINNAPQDVFRARCASLAIKARSGWTYNRMFAQEVVLKF